MAFVFVHFLSLMHRKTQKIIELKKPHQGREKGEGQL